MSTFRVSSLVLLCAACGVSEQEELVGVGPEAVAVRACRLYDEPESVCQGAPQDTAPFSEEAGGPADRWLLVPKGGLILASQRSVGVGDREWYEVALPAGARGFVPAPLAEPLPQMFEPRVIEPSLRVLPEGGE
jgi:hypothetical protein